MCIYTWINWEKFSILSTRWNFPSKRHLPLFDIDFHIHNKSEIHIFLNYLVFLTRHDGNMYDYKIIDHTKFRYARNDIEAGLQLFALKMKYKAGLQLFALKMEVQDDDYILVSHQGMSSGLLQEYIWTWILLYICFYPQLGCKLHECRLVFIYHSIFSA